MNRTNSCANCIFRGIGVGKTECPYVCQEVADNFVCPKWGSGMEVTGKYRKVYIAGPMSSLPLFNFPAFDATAIKLRGEGYIVVNPADIDRAHGLNEHHIDFSPSVARACILRDIAAMCDGCTHIAMLPGWEKSKGANVEIAVARYLGLQVLYL